MLAIGIDLATMNILTFKFHNIFAALSESDEKFVILKC